MGIGSPATSMVRSRLAEAATKPASAVLSLSSIDGPKVSPSAPDTESASEMRSRLMPAATSCTTWAMPPRSWMVRCRCCSRVAASTANLALGQQGRRLQASAAQLDADGGDGRHADRRQDAGQAIGAVAEVELGVGVPFAEFGAERHEQAGRVEHGGTFEAERLGDHGGTTLAALRPWPRLGAEPAGGEPLAAQHVDGKVGRLCRLQQRRQLHGRGCGRQQLEVAEIGPQQLHAAGRAMGEVGGNLHVLELDLGDRAAGGVGEVGDGGAGSTEACKAARACRRGRAVDRSVSTTRWWSASASSSR